MPKHYIELWEMIKSGKAIINGKISQKLSDYKKIELEFRLSAPKCNNADSCNNCKNKNLCW